MISFKELLGNHNINEIPLLHQHNLETLLQCVNKLRADWGKPMTVTSGYRSLQDHLRIYAAKGITDRNKIPMSSNHLIGKACDFADADGSLYAWAYNNQDKLAEYGIWCEKDTNVGIAKWLHCQCVPPKSGNRFFLP